MQKLDRLGWAAGAAFRSYGVRIGIRTNRPEVLDQLQPYLPPGAKRTDSEIVDSLYSLIVAKNGAPTNIRHFNILYVGALRLVRALHMEELLRILEFDTMLHVAERARGRVFVHAGAVGWQGKAIIIPGQSFTGKTTLVAELVRAGATYYSDEYAILDRRGRVHPFPRPLSMRREGEAAWLAEKCPVESLGGVAGRKPLPVGLVVATHYKSGAKWKPRTLSRGQGALEILANTVPARRKPGDALAALQRVVMDAPVLKSARGDARRAAEAILNFATDGHCW
jgi:hypothetical protein